MRSSISKLNKSESSVTEPAETISSFRICCFALLISSCCRWLRGAAILPDKYIAGEIDRAKLMKEITPSDYLGKTSR